MYSRRLALSGVILLSSQASKVGHYARLRLTSCITHCCVQRSVHPPAAADSSGDRDKVAAVCSALRSAMQTAGQRYHLGPILTSYAKQGDLEAALAVVKQLKEEQLADAQAQRKANPLQSLQTRTGLAANSGVVSEYGHVNGHAGVDPDSYTPAEPSPATEVASREVQSPRLPNGISVGDGERQDADSDRPADGHKLWTAEDGLRHLLLYSDVDRLYRCRPCLPLIC